jgi:hypothetical protein
MDEIMAEQKQQEELQQENEVLDKKQLKAAKKLEKKKRKQKNPDDLDGDEETVGGKILVFFVTIIIILIWLAIFAMLIKLDVGGFGSGVLAPVIKDVPYLNKILPDSVTEEVSSMHTQIWMMRSTGSKSLRLSLQMPRTVQILMQIILHS